MYRYVIITPVRNEKAFIAKTLTSVMGQTVLPVRWVIVDDGSSDGTSEIVESGTAGTPWITVVHRPDRGYRLSGGGVIEAFYAGYSVCADEPWDFIVKLDGDVSFAQDYFERCFDRFAADPRLGVGGGTVLRAEPGTRTIDSRDPAFHVRGATKIYRRACWERIGPLVMGPGWDTIDEVKANLYGWSTRTFSDLELVHHKPTGAADGRWRDSYKNGRANYAAGYHPVFMLAKCVKRALRRPVFVESIGLMAGYCSGYVQAVPQAEREVVRYLRKQQVRRLLLRPGLYGQWRRQTGAGQRA